MQDNQQSLKKKRGRPKKETLKSSEENEVIKSIPKLKKKAFSALLSEDEALYDGLTRNQSEAVNPNFKEKQPGDSNKAAKKKDATDEKEFRIKKKVKKDPTDKNQLQKSDSQKAHKEIENRQQRKPVQITLPKFNISKLFYDILSLANKDEDFLMMISNILTTGSRQLNDKKVIIRKKRTTLQGSNLSQQEYLKKEKELLKVEKEEIEEVKSNIISRLSISKIKGFETKETIIESEKLQKLQESNSNEVEFEINEENFNELKELQLKLLDRLLEERSFVNPDLKISKYKSLSEKLILEDESKTKVAGEANRLEGTDSKKISDPKRSESNKKTIIMYKYLEEGEISEKDYLNEKTKEVFADFVGFCKMNKDNVFSISKYEKASLLELKTDYLYIEEKFQRYQFQKFQKLIKEIEEKGEFELKEMDEETVHDLIKLTAYVLNNVHYFQKFKINSEFINPYDLLYLLEKIK